MTETALTTTEINYPAMANLNPAQLKALLKLQQAYERAKDKDRLLELGKVIMPFAGLIGGWWFIEYGNKPNNMWWSRDQKGSDFSATVLQLGLIALVVSAEGEGLAKLVDAIVPF